MAQHTQDNNNEIQQMANQLNSMKIQVNHVRNDIKKTENELLSYDEKMKKDELLLSQLETRLLNKLDELEEKHVNTNINEEKSAINEKDDILHIRIQCHECLHEIQPNINQQIYINDKDIKVLCNNCFSSNTNSTENTSEWTNYVWNQNETSDMNFNNKLNFVIQCSIAKYGIGPTLDKISELLELQSKLQQKHNLKYVYIEKILNIGLNDINNDELNDTFDDISTSDNIIPNINDIADIVNNMNHKREMDDDIFSNLGV